jgi:hypothetical protein
MPPTNGFKRELYKGIPVWRNELNELFIYGTEKPYTKIGDSNGLLADWKEIYEPIITSFRTGLEVRSRSNKIYT